MPHTLDRMPQVAVLLPSSVKVSRGNVFAGRVRKAGFDCHLYGTLPKAVQEDAGIGMPDVVRHTRASRRLAEQRFRQALGHTILDEILRVRLADAEVAIRFESAHVRDPADGQVGLFEQGAYVVFRKLHACTMRDYRINR